MTGNLYVIGVGPGDPELLTLKAVRILEKTSCICVPKGREEGSSLALSIVQRVIDLHGKEILETYFPMRKTRTQNTEHRIQTNPPFTKGEHKESLVSGSSSLRSHCELDTRWQETVETVLSRLNKGQDMAFITLGDPTIYSTFFYLYDSLIELSPGLNIEIIPGVSSINAAAAKAKISLGLANEKIAVLPVNYINELKETLKNFDTIVLMKVHKDFKRIVKTLSDTGLLNNAIYISRVGADDEKIFKNIRDIKEEDLNYFSMVIVRNG